ncbi:tlde1 domain-containing protein [Citrobacter portucalensis]
MQQSLREDEKLDDVTFYSKVSRGYFRLHPAGYKGVSNGCITLPSRAHYNILRQALLNTPRILVTSSIRAYGTIQVY